MRRLINNDHGVAEAFGTIFMVMIFLVLIGRLMAVGGEILQENKEELQNEIEEVIQNAIINAFNDTIPEIEYTNQTITITIPVAQNDTIYKIPK